jgi:predicted Holliday junction resolvase-like endonuclease
MLMEHWYIEEYNIIDRYLMRKLSDEDLVRFETHFLDCGQCLKEMEMTERLRALLRRATAEEVLRSHSNAQVEPFARVARRARVRQMAYLSCFMLLILLPMLWLALKWRSAHQDLARANETISERQLKSAEREQTLTQEMQARERQWLVQRDQLVVQIENERKKHRRLASEINKVAGLRSALPIFVLSPARSRASGLSSPVNRIILSSPSESVILMLEFEPDLDIQSYRATLLTADKRSVWRESQLKLGSKGTIALGFNGSLLKPNQYLLTLEGLTSQAHYVPIAQYRVQVLTR